SPVSRQEALPAHRLLEDPVLRIEAQGGDPSVDRKCELLAWSIQYDAVTLEIVLAIDHQIDRQSIAGLRLRDFDRGRARLLAVAVAEPGRSGAAQPLLEEPAERLSVSRFGDDAKLFD